MIDTIHDSKDANPVNLVIDFQYFFEFTYALARTVQGQTLFMPSHVVDMVERYDQMTRRTRKTFKGIIDKSVARGYIKLIETNLNEPGGILDGQAIAGLAPDERGMINASEKLRQANIASIIVTGSAALAKILKGAGIECLTLDEAKTIDKTRPEKIIRFDHVLEREITSVKFVEAARVARRIFLGIGLSLVGMYIVFNLKTLVSKTPIWLSILIFCVLAILAFRLRERHRTIYGSAELMSGMISLYYVLIEVLSNPYDTGAIRLSFSLKILATIYIMVRGLDNIYKSIQKTNLGFILRRRLGLKD